jgi:hypothetical protein
MIGLAILASWNSRPKSDSMSRRKPRLTFQKACGFVVAVSILIGLSSGENWQLRWTAAALFLLATTSILTSSIVSRDFQCIGPRLTASSLKVQITIEVLGRLLILGLAIFSAPILFKICLDFYDLFNHGYPPRVEAVVTYVPGGAVWNWIWKDVGLETTDGKSARYNLFFHPRHPTQGQRYGVVLLPKSERVLSFQPVIE